MAKIPFDIKYRPQIESGEYKIIYLSYTTEEEYPARIICWDRHNEHPIVALVSNSGGYERVQMFQEEGIDNNNPHLGTLFIVTPEEELSEFEKAVGLEIFDEPFGEEHIKVIKEESAKLLAIARNEIIKSGYAIIEGEHYLEEGRKNYERGKAEALKDLQENLANNDIYSVPEWMREVLLMAKENGKKEALKDLPRWKPAARAYTGDRLPRIDWLLKRLVAKFEEGIFYLDMNDLYKLPGFKEDSYE